MTHKTTATQHLERYTDLILREQIKDEIINTNKDGMTFITYHNHY